MIMGKRGQMFLVAAVIVVGLIFGASRTLNYVSAGSDQEAFYDLTDELGFEVARVLDYGVLNNPASTGVYANNFLDQYTEYILGEEVVYIYVNHLGEVYAIHYVNSVLTSSVQLRVGGSFINFPIQQITGTTADIERTYEQTVTVKINGITYPFNLRKGQGFYFVIIKDDNDERVVAI